MYTNHAFIGHKARIISRLINKSIKNIMKAIIITTILLKKNQEKICINFLLNELNAFNIDSIFYGEPQNRPSLTMTVNKFWWISKCKFGLFVKIMARFPPNKINFWKYTQFFTGNMSLLPILHGIVGSIHNLRSNQRLRIVFLKYSRKISSFII